MIDTEPTLTPSDDTVRVLSVQEGFAQITADGGHRVFSVVLSRPADDLAIIETATDPDKKHLVAIPAAGTEHPQFPGFVARPPMIYPVGVRMKDGPMIAARSCFYNVKVPYIKKS